MGGAGSTFLTGEAATNRRIAKEMLATKRKEEEQIKLLLIGCGESGKSTVFKQMKLIYGVPWTEAELAEMRPTIYTNIILNLRAVARQVQIEDQGGALDAFGSKFAAGEEIKDACDITPELGAKFKALWSLPSMANAWKRRSEFQVLDSLEYYMRDIDRISAGPALYLPTQQDVLHSRVRTSGITEETYMIDGVPFVLYDAGGQRNERKKWIHAFQFVNGVIYVCAINEYDQVLFEDKRTNRLDESLRTFKEVATSEWFAQTSIILFLNKIDLFREKLPHSPFRLPGMRNDDFKGPYAEEGKADLDVCVSAAQAYISDLFLKSRLPLAAQAQAVSSSFSPSSKTRSPPPQSLYIHLTQATDTRLTELVISAAKDSLMRANLRVGGFIA